MSDFKKQQRSLKQPDAFQEKMLDVFEKLKKNTHIVALVAAPIILAFAGVFAFQAWRGSQVEARRVALAKIDEVFSEEAKAGNKVRQEIGEKITALNPAMKDDPKAKLDPEADKKHEKERAELEKQLEAVKDDHTKSLPMYEEFFRTHDSDVEGWKAALSAANIQIQDKKFNEAATNLEAMLNKAGSHDFYGNEGRILYISVLEELGKFDTALAQADILASTMKGDGIPKALLIKGRVQLFAGKQAEALATFDKLISEYNSSAQAQKAKALRALHKG